MDKDIDKEEAVLCAILLNNKVMPLISAILEPEYFTDPRNRLIYTTTKELFNKNSKIDSLTVRENLENKGVFSDAGGVEYLMTIVGKISSEEHVEDHAMLIVQASIVRDLKKEVNQLNFQLSNPLEYPLELINQHEQKLSNLKNRMIQGSSMTKESLTKHFTKEILDIQSGINPFIPFSGINDLDELLAGGLRPGELVTIGARPGIGKTMMATTIATYCAFSKNVPAFILGLEMSAKEYHKRIISSTADLDFGVLNKGTNVDLFDQKLESALEQFEEKPLFISFSRSADISNVRAQLHQMKQQEGIKLAIIDHGGLIKRKYGSGSSSVEEIGEITSTLKMTAIELDISIVLIWQLNRESVNNPKAPKGLSALRGSGRIEEDSDKVIFLEWPGGENGFKPDGIVDVNDAKVSVLKNRNGKTGEVLVKRYPEFMRFENWQPSNEF